MGGASGHGPLRVTSGPPSCLGLKYVKFLERQGASAAVGGEVGRESGDAFEEVLGADIEIEDSRVPLRSAVF